MHEIKTPWLTRQLIRSAGDAIAAKGKGAGSLCIVNYHRILAAPDPLLESEPTLAMFRSQMELLAECFNVLPLHDAVNMLAKERMPPRAVAITFDDGYRSTHDYAMPVLKDYGLPATVFVTTGHLDKGSMWNDIILEAVRRLSPLGRLDLNDIGLGAHRLTTDTERRNTVFALTERSKYLVPTARAQLTSKLELLAGETLDQELMLTRDMVRALDSNGIEIGGHTITHPILTRIDDEAARKEISGNKLHLEEILGKPVRLFAYPNGKHGLDYDARHVQMVGDAGYSAAFTTAMGAARATHSRFEMPRSRPWDANRLMFAGRLLRWLHGRSA
ncbi:MAG: polysaccharide deacetylase family protein [Telluria sp.]